MNDLWWPLRGVAGDGRPGGLASPGIGGSGGGAVAASPGRAPQLRVKLPPDKRRFHRLPQWLVWPLWRRPQALGRPCPPPRPRGAASVCPAAPSVPQQGPGDGRWGRVSLPSPVGSVAPVAASPGPRPDPSTRRVGPGMPRAPQGSAASPGGWQGASTHPNLNAAVL